MLHATDATLLFRIATLNDVNNIVELVHAAYRGDASRSGWTTEADFLEGSRTDTDEVSGLILSDQNIILLGEQNSGLAVSVHLQNTESHTYLGMFAVRPAMQKSGIGKAMIHYAEHFARNNWHAVSMRMSVITLRTELIAWYERRGYRRTGTFRPFPYGIARYGTPKRNDLLLEILEKDLK